MNDGAGGVAPRHILALRESGLDCRSSPPLVPPRWPDSPPSFAHNPSADPARPRMTITHIATSLDGGAGLGLWRYHEALRSAGVASRILVSQAPAQPFPECAVFGWRKRAFPRRLLMRLGWDTRMEARLRRELVKLDRRALRTPDYELFSFPYSDYIPERHPWVADADLIVIHWIAGSLDWPRFFRRVDCPTVFVLHDQQPYLGGFHYELDAQNNPHLAALDWRVREIKRRALPAHTAVMANSEWNAARARASGFYHASTPIETVLYPLDRSRYRPLPDARARLELPADKLVIGFACENLVNSRKGFADLLDALPLLPATLRARLQLLSFGRTSAPALSVAGDLPWRNLGFLADEETKILAYSAMDVFVAPSHAEAFGLTALEAQACGVPVVAAPVGGLAEAVADPLPLPFGRTASPRDLAESLVRLLETPALRRQQAERGLALVRDRHDPAMIGTQLSSFLSGFISSASRR